MMNKKFGWTRVESGLPGLGEWVLIADMDGAWSRAVLVFHNGHVSWMQDEPTIPAHTIKWWSSIEDVPMLKEQP